MAESKTTVLTYIKVDFWFLLLFIVIHIAATFTKSLYFLLYVCSVCVMKKNAALGPLSKISMYAKNTKVKHLSVHCNSVDVFVRCCHDCSAVCDWQSQHNSGLLTSYESSNT